MLRAGHREVWTATHGRARVWHVATDHDVAACKSDPNYSTFRKTIPLGEFVDAADVPDHLRCKRNGCKQRWPPGPGTGIGF